jgi:DMSO/TMAO reductase YedYZ molybdopterin-dependent catalytic subunit
MKSVLNQKVLIVFAVLFLSLLPVSGGGIYEKTESQVVLPSVEIIEYKGEKLSSITDLHESAIKGTQHIDRESYRLEITGLVDNPVSYTYEEVLNFKPCKKVVTLHCVEGWSVSLLWEGVLLREVLEKTEPRPDATVVIFHAHDGYTTSLSLDYIREKNILMAYKMNGVTLPPEKGFPFQLVAENKWGYKWIKWITKIELSDNENFRGYWEKKGYSQNGDQEAPVFE